MKKLCLLVIATLFGLAASAQLVQKESFEFNKQTVTGYVVSFSSDKSVELVSSAIKNRLEKNNNLKPGKKVSGFTSYINQQLPPLGVSFVNIYTKVEQSGKKNNKETKLYFLVCSDNGEPISATTHPAIDAATKQYLSEFGAYLIDFENNQNLHLHTGNLEKSKKELTSLQAEKQKLEKENTKMIQKMQDKESEIKAKQDAISQLELEIQKLQGLLSK